MSAPVDVLAVLDGAAFRAGLGADKTDYNRLVDARAAIAELMEHDKALREALGTCERWFTKHSPTAPLIGGHGEAEHPMLTMLRAALRSVGGAE